MKKMLLVFAALAAATWLRAQSNEPLKLALVAESSTAAAAVDILTAELSTRPALHLLERNEIERLYREQGLAAGNLEGLKLGRVLGADGVMIVSSVSEAQNLPMMSLPGFGGAGRQRPSQTLEARLLAVKPGVILGSSRATCREEDLVAWAKGIAARFAPEFPKLGVLAKDALPISVVNLRSATDSAQSRETERQLTLLTIQRLARERNLFLLERRRMDLLSAEKDLKLDDSAFWSGSYLLEGVVDQEGYSKDRVTLDVRLVPPKGGTPIQVKTSGSRTNLAETVNQLAAKIVQALNLTPTLKDWNAAEEASQYFDEAQWALRWGLFEQVQAAAETAWALGKRDTDTATLRVKACLVAPTYDIQRRGSITIHNNSPTRADAARRPPDAASADRAQRALELFLEHSRTLDPDTVKPDSPWYRLGIEDLTLASRWLQQFYLVPQAQQAARANLERLRSSARGVADWLAQLPAARAGYNVKDREVSGDEVYHAYVEGTNVFRCAINWGCFWQEKPEDTLALYRELMQGSLFVCIHAQLWFRAPNRPVLVGWTAEDELRLPAVWRGFRDELSASTNAFCRMEAKAITFAAARAEFDMPRTSQLTQRTDRNPQAQPVAAPHVSLSSACDALFDFLCTKFDAIVAGNDNLPQLGFGLDVFFNRSGMATPETETLQQRFKADYAPRLAAVQQEYIARNSERLKENRTRGAVEKQKQFLADFTPYDFRTFNQVFASRDYTKSQAAQLRPLLDAYCSNLVAQAAGKPGAAAFQAYANSTWITNFVGRELEKAIHPPPPATALSGPAPQPPPPSPAISRPLTSANVPGPNPLYPAIGRPFAPANFPTPQTAPVTNALQVTDAVTVPIERLGLTNTHIPAGISAYRWTDGKLLLTLWYQGPFERYSLVSQTASAIFDPQVQSWNLIPHPTNGTSHTLASLPGGMLLGGHEKNAYSELFQGHLYLSDGGQISRFDPPTRQWQNVEVPENLDSQLFALDGHLYAASQEIIFEILEGGTATKVLASTRRRPAVSSLDSLESFGSLPAPPLLFSGPSHSLCAAFASRVVAWDGADWRELFKLDFARSPEPSAEAVVFRSFATGEPSRLWFLRNGQSRPELCLQDTGGLGLRGPIGQVRPLAGPPARPLWQPYEDTFLVRAPVTAHEGNLYFFVEQSFPGGLSRGPAPAGPDQPQPRLVCLLHDSPRPVVIPLSFAPRPGAPSPSPSRRAGRSGTSAWMQFSGDYLFLGQGGFAGFWRIPVSKIQTALAAERKSPTGERAASGK